MTLNNKSADCVDMLDCLIGGWGERRAVRPLQCLIRVYPSTLANQDQIYLLLEALHVLKFVSHRDLMEAEFQSVNKIIDMLRELLAEPFVDPLRF